MSAILTRQSHTKILLITPFLFQSLIVTSIRKMSSKKPFNSDTNVFILPIYLQTHFFSFHLIYPGAFSFSKFAFVTLLLMHKLPSLNFYLVAYSVACEFAWRLRIGIGFGGSTLMFNKESPSILILGIFIHLSTQRSPSPPCPFSRSQTKSHTGTFFSHRDTMYDITFSGSLKVEEQQKLRFVGVRPGLVFFLVT